jgi:hypothetical protein
MCFRQGKHFQLKIFSSSLRLFRRVESEKNISESQRGGRNEIAFFPFFRISPPPRKIEIPNLKRRQATSNSLPYFIGEEFLKINT